MTLLLVLFTSLAVVWWVRKLITDRSKPQREEPRSFPLNRELPRALTYTEMMNSGKQRVIKPPPDED
jgi:hypothetical protein